MTRLAAHRRECKDDDASAMFKNERGVYRRLRHHDGAPYVPKVFGYLEFTTATAFTESLSLPLLSEALLSRANRRGDALGREPHLAFRYRDHAQSIAL
jgi:hypothetical protein